MPAALLALRAPDAYAVSRTSLQEVGRFSTETLPTRKLQCMLACLRFCLFLLCVHAYVPAHGIHVNVALTSQHPIDSGHQSAASSPSSSGGNTQEVS